MGNEISVLSCGAVAPREVSESLPSEFFPTGSGSMDDTNFAGDGGNSHASKVLARYHASEKREATQSLMSFVMKSACSGPGACGGSTAQGDIDVPLTRTRTLYPDNGRPTIRHLKTPKGLRIRTYSWRVANPLAQVLLIHTYGSHSLFDWLYHDLENPEKKPSYTKSWVENMNLSGFSVYALDLQGHGFSSSWNGRRCNVEVFDDYREDVIQMIQEHMNTENNKNRPVFLMGVSMGACVAVRAAEAICQRNLIRRPTFMGKDDEEIADIQRIFGNTTPAMVQRKKELCGLSDEEALAKLLEMEAELNQGIPQKKAPKCIPRAGGVTEGAKREFKVDVEQEALTQGGILSKGLCEDPSTQAANGDMEETLLEKSDFDARSDISSEGMTESSNIVPVEASAGAGINLCGCGAGTVDLTDAKDAASADTSLQIPLGGLLLLAPMLGLDTQTADQPGSSSMLPFVSSILPNVSVAERPRNFLYPEVDEITEQDGLTFKGLQRARLAQEMLSAIKSAQDDATWLGLVVSGDRLVSTVSTADEDVQEITDCENPPPTAHQLSVLVIRSKNDKVVDSSGTDRFYQTISGGHPEFVFDAEKENVTPLSESSSSDISTSTPESLYWSSDSQITDASVIDGKKHNKQKEVPSKQSLVKTTGDGFKEESTVTSKKYVSCEAKTTPANPVHVEEGEILKYGGTGKLTKLRDMEKNCSVGLTDDVDVNNDLEDDGRVASVGDDALITTHPEPSISEEFLNETDETGNGVGVSWLPCGANKQSEEAPIPPLKTRQMWILEDMNHWLHKEIGNERLSGDILSRWLLPRSLGI